VRTSGVLILSATFLVGALAQAASFEQSQVDPDTSATAEHIRLLPCSITQNDAPDIVHPGSVACSGGGIATDNWFGRVYDLGGDHAITGSYCVSDMDYALESVSDPTPTKYQVSCVADGTSGNPAGIVSVAALDAGEVFSVNIIDGPASLEFFNVALGGCCDADNSDLAIFSITADCQEVGCGGYWPGSNSLGQTERWYIGAPDCGIVDPIDIQLLGFVDVHLIQLVNGDADSCESPDEDDGGVPASRGSTALLIVLVLLAGSGYFLRRRAAD